MSFADNSTGGNGIFTLNATTTSLAQSANITLSENAASLISADGNIIYGWGLNSDDLIEMYKVVLN
jgi:hypothetical protein